VVELCLNSHEICPLRTDEDYANLQYSDHQKGASPLINHGIACVKWFPLDYIHGLFRGRKTIAEVPEKWTKGM
jgi:hypothetical protein